MKTPKGYRRLRIGEKLRAGDVWELFTGKFGHTTLIGRNVEYPDVYFRKNPRKTVNTESSLEEFLVAECRRRGLYCRKFTSPAHKGVPDRVICGKGKTLFLELKAPGKRPTPLQKRELDILTTHGMIAAWTDSKPGVMSLLDNQWA